MIRYGVLSKMESFMTWFCRYEMPAGEFIYGAYVAKKWYSRRYNHLCIGFVMEEDYTVKVRLLLTENWLGPDWYAHEPTT